MISDPGAVRGEAHLFGNHLLDAVRENENYFLSLYIMNRVFCQCLDTKNHMCCNGYRQVDVDTLVPYIK